jgi:hypothetical protein
VFVVQAANLFRRMTLSNRFPPLSQMTQSNLQALKPVLPGMSLTQLQQLPRDALRSSRAQLAHVHFGESQVGLQTAALFI